MVKRLSSALLLCLVSHCTYLLCFLSSLCVCLHCPVVIIHTVTGTSLSWSSKRTYLLQGALSYPLEANLTLISSMSEFTKLWGMKSFSFIRHLSGRGRWYIWLNDVKQLAACGFHHVVLPAGFLFLTPVNSFLKVEERFKGRSIIKISQRQAWPWTPAIRGLEKLR